MINKTLRADLLLLFVALLWGATFPFMSEAVKVMSPFYLVSLRFLVAGLFILPFIWAKLVLTDKKVLRAGFILGVLNAMVYLLQTMGMRQVDADTTAFLASAGVVFVPFLAPFFKLAKVRAIEVFGSLICLIGLYVLVGGNLSHFNAGELAILLAAVAWALSVCYIQKITPHIKQPGLLAFYQIVFLLPFAFLVTPLDHHFTGFKPIVILTVLYTGIFATTIVFLIQMRYQKDTTATHAAIIYSLEPVFASVIAIYVNKQPITENITLGGGAILLSVLVIEILPRLQVKLRSKS